MSQTSYVALAKVSMWGMVISFLGTLPLSPLNVAALQISLHEGVANAMYFSIGTILIEMVYVRISLIGLSWIRKQDKFFKWMEWVILILIIAFAAGSFYASQQKQNSQNILLDKNLNRFLLGMVMSAVNVIQIPFWLAWSTVLFSKKILKHDGVYYGFYITFLAVGTFLANCIFIFGGLFITKKMNTNQQTMNLIIGWIFTLTAIIQLVKILIRKDPSPSTTEVSQ